MANYYNENEMLELWSRYDNLSDAEKKYFWDKTILVINGVIYTHQFIKFNCSFDDMQQEAILALITALPRFNPNYVNKQGKPTTLFNYTSLVAKRSIKFYTMKQSSHHTSAMHENQSIEDFEILSEDRISSPIYKLICKTIQETDIVKDPSRKTLKNIAYDFSNILASKEAMDKRQALSILKHKYRRYTIRVFWKILKTIKEELYSILS